MSVNSADFSREEMHERISAIEFFKHKIEQI